MTHASLQGLKYMSKEEGIRGMFRGNWTNCVRIIPNSAVKFLTYEQLSRCPLHLRALMLVFFYQPSLLALDSLPTSSLALHVIRPASQAGNFCNAHGQKAAPLHLSLQSKLTHPLRSAVAGAYRTT